mmetsp:Transcript_32868/g.94341  ORF Transcript_32868/g.94341 Transcript_32868/m.94341 type:complete len:350 (-) Transcript_32868:394-1443(-)
MEREPLEGEVSGEVGSSRPPARGGMRPCGGHIILQAPKTRDGWSASQGTASSNVEHSLAACSASAAQKPSLTNSSASTCFLAEAMPSGGPAALSASSCRVTRDTSLGTGLWSRSPALPSSSRTARSIGAGEVQLPPRSRSARKSPASSKNQAGRLPLCPPSKTRSTRSPPQASWRSWVWYGNTNTSSEATPKNAGQTASGADLIGASSNGSNFARDRTSDRTVSKAQPNKNCGTGNFPLLTKSSATVRKSRKAESNTHAASSRSSAARKIDVVAPMDLPHKPIAPTSSRLRKYWRTTRKSFSSWCPREMYSPSEQPEPERSKQKTVMSRGKSTGNTSKASKREEQLPCK